MCDFLTLSLRADNAELLKRAMHRRLAVRPAANADVDRHLPRDFRSFHITSHGCSCNLYYPQAPADDRTANADRLRADYRKSGWSEAKIARAVAQATRPRKADNSFAGLRPDLCERLATLAEDAGGIAIFDEFYACDPAIEAVNVTRICRVSAADFRAGTYPTARGELVFVGL